MTPREPTQRTTPRREWMVLADIVAVSILSRLPFLSTFDMVTYDGTYYIRQAKQLIDGVFATTFPNGYPAAILAFRALIPDWVIAAQMVSFLASVGTAYLVYRIAMRLVSWRSALCAALLTAINPLFIRMSLMTFAESLFLFFTALGILLAMRGRNAGAGVSLGAASVTRPEALAVLGIVGAARARKPRALLILLAGFAVVYGVNAAATWRSTGAPVKLELGQRFGSSAADWKLREKTIEFDGSKEMFETLEAEEREKRNVLADYSRRLPGEVWRLVRHAGPLAFLLALAGIARLRLHLLLAPLAFFLLFPLFTIRADDRYVYSYLPFIMIYALVGLEWARSRKLVTAGYAMLGLGAVALFLYDGYLVRTPEEPGVRVLKDAGIAIRAYVEPGDTIAARKPFLPFYAGGTYAEIPVAPYNEVIDHIVASDTRWLALHLSTTHALRPALRPLLYSQAVVGGEIRLDPVHFDPDGAIVYRRVGEPPETWRRLTEPVASDIAPAWSPDGTKLAFRRTLADSTSVICVATRVDADAPWDVANLSVRRIAEADGARDVISWSPDGTRIAFAKNNGETGFDLFAISADGGRATLLVSGPGDNVSPAWLPDGRVAYALQRDGRSDVWITTPGAGVPERVTNDGAATFPAAAPAGAALAWCSPGRGVFIRDLADGDQRVVQVPANLGYAPSWGPGGRTLAVDASDWGSWDIYLMTSDATNVILLTKLTSREGMPAWHPSGDAIAVASDRSGRWGLWLIDGIAPYVERLEQRRRFSLFTPPADSRRRIEP